MPHPRRRLVLLKLEAGDYNGGPGSFTGHYFIWAYRPNTDKSEQIWFDASYGDRNEDTRTIEKGPLAGDIIVTTNDPTDHWPWPWPYGIDVFHLTPSLHYTRVLYLIGKSTQGNGPPGPAIDADMPEILRQLGVSNSK